MLEGLHCALTRLGLQPAILGHVDDLAHFPLVLDDFSLDSLYNLRFSNDVLYTYRETCVHEPVVDHELDV